MGKHMTAQRTSKTFAETLAQSRHLLRRERLIWERLANHLYELIPTELTLFVHRIGWVPPTDPQAQWRFPLFVKHLALLSQEGFGVDLRLHESDLSQYGFKSPTDANIKLLLLQLAWNQLVSITFQYNFPYVQLTFWEYESKELREQQQEASPQVYPADDPE